MRPPAAVRAATRSDVDAVLPLALQAAAEAGANTWREALLSDVEDVDRHLVVAELAGEIVGYGRVRLFVPGSDAPAETAPRGYYLQGLFVRPDARLAGIGAALVDGRLQWIGQRADEAWFFANARNDASIGLHQRFGFEEVTRCFSFPQVTFDGGEGILFRARLR